MRASTRRTRASRTHCQRVNPLGREGLAILALRTLNRQPYFFISVLSSSLWKRRKAAHLICYPTPCSTASAQRAPRAAARFVDQSRMVKKLMQPHARNISGGLRAVHDTEWGLDSRSLGWMTERGGRCPSLDDFAHDDNGLHTLSARAAEPFPQRESAARGTPP